MLHPNAVSVAPGKNQRSDARSLYRALQPRTHSGVAAVAQHCLRRCALLGLAGVLAGCAASGTQYYSLQPAISKVTTVPSIVTDALNVQDVNVPASVDRPQIVVAGSQGGAVSVLNNSLWIAPLADEIRTALAHRLSAQLGVPDLNRSGAPQGLPLWTVQLSVDRFEAVYGRNVVIESHWRLGHVPEQKVAGLPMVCRAQVEVPVSTGVDAVVQGWQQAIALLADQVALQVQRARISQPLDPRGATSVQGVTMLGCTQPPARS